MSWISRRWVKHLDKRIDKYKRMRTRINRNIKEDRKLRKFYWDTLTVAERLELSIEMGYIPPVPKPKK